MFDCDLASEYQVSRDELGLSDELLARAARASIEGSAAPDWIRSAALAGIREWLASA